MCTLQKLFKGNVFKGFTLPYNWKKPLQKHGSSWAVYRSCDHMNWGLRCKPQTKPGLRQTLVYKSICAYPCNWLKHLKRAIFQHCKLRIHRGLQPKLWHLSTILTTWSSFKHSTQSLGLPYKWSYLLNLSSIAELTSLGKRLILITYTVHFNYSKRFTFRAVYGCIIVVNQG